MPLHVFLTLPRNPSLVRHANISRASRTHRQDASLENNRSSVMCFPIAASCTGPVPDVFGALSRLEMLALSSNRLTGEGCVQRSIMLPHSRELPRTFQKATRLRVGNVVCM